MYGTVNLILSADQMDLLSSDPLKAQLSAFPGVNAQYKTYEALSMDIALRQRELHKSYVAILSMDPDLQTQEQVQHQSDFLRWLRSRDHQNLVIDRMLQNRNAYEALLKLMDSNQSILDLINRELNRF